GHENIYGTRGLIFANDGYAIHGTNNPKSIGQAVSLGCIRLQNPDVEELYSFASPGTEVIISDKQMPFRSWSNPARFQLPAGPEEETPKVVYHWLH
ncbi:L,D-transpeptidase, partial [Frankia sp. Cpl3]|nr:L,D-transpeptidase [Frankia sp. Cpl3]